VVTSTWPFPVLTTVTPRTTLAATSISSMMTVLVVTTLFGDNELTALSSCPVEVPTKITSNLDPSTAVTCGSTAMDVKAMFRPVRIRTGWLKKGGTASFMSGWVLMKFKLASVSSLLLFGQEPETKIIFYRWY
jgi:hypothetical protein